MKVLRLFLLLLGVACLVVTASVNYSRTVTAAGEVSELRIGFEPSPWVRREVRDGVASSKLNVLSGSALFALGAAVCFGAYARLGRVPAGPDRRDSSAEPGAAPDRGRI
jgi:hypothetical protein